MYIPPVLSFLARLLPIFNRRDRHPSLSPPADPRFPVDRPSLSYWLQGVRADPLLDWRSTEELPSEAEVVIIGSGLTGSLIAHTLLNAERPLGSVVLLEAREFCSGATGRNAGHCKPDQYRGFLKYAAHFGEEEAHRILQNEWDTFTGLVQYVRENDVDCDLWVGDTLDVAMTDEVLRSSSEAYHAYVGYAGDHIAERVREDLNATSAQERSRISGAKAVWSWPAAALYPWKLAAHLVRNALDKGLNLQTHTRVNSVKAGSDSLWTVHTDRGAIAAKKVVHATNAFAATLLPLLEAQLRPTPFVCTKMIPPPAYSGARRLNNTYGVILSPSAMFSINPRPSSDGAVLFGGDGPNQAQLEQWVRDDPTLRGDDRIGNYAPISDAVEEFAEKHFAGWGSKMDMAVGEGLDYNWSGVLGMTKDHLPLVGRVPGLPGQYVAAGFNGHGMARIFTVAPALAQLVLHSDRTYEQTGLPRSFEISLERLASMS